MSRAVIQAAAEKLLQTQARDGGWATFADEPESSLLSTCAAVHGLAMAKPNGWEGATRRAARWLLQQQNSLGAWYVQGGPTVMLTVLALDAIELGQGGNQVTFGGTTVKGSIRSRESETAYDCTREEWHKPKPPKTTSKTVEEARTVAQPTLAVMVATEIELRQALHRMTPLPRRASLWKVVHGHETYYIGRFGSFETVLTLCSMGAGGPGGSTLTVNEAIQLWDPKLVLMVGIAFGANPKKQLAADVLVDSVIPYEHQRVDSKVNFRSPVPPASSMLVNRFRNAIDWEFCRPDGTKCQMHVGPVFSGDKLVDNADFKKALVTEYPHAVGGEMEGAGLYAAASRTQKPWALVKGVCDWGDGNKHKSFQEMAAAASISLCQYVFDDPRVLDGV